MGMHAQVMIEMKPKVRRKNEHVVWHPVLGRSIPAGRDGVDYAIGMTDAVGLGVNGIPDDLAPATNAILQSDGVFNSGKYMDTSGCCRFTHLSLSEFEKVTDECGRVDGWARVYAIMKALEPLADVRVIVGWSW